MIQAKVKPAPRRVSPNPGHVLLLLWLGENKERKQRFDQFLEHTNAGFDFEMFTTVLNGAAMRCLDEYNELYPALCDSLANDDLQSLYIMMKESYTN